MYNFKKISRQVNKNINDAHFKSLKALRKNSLRSLDFFSVFHTPQKVLPIRKQVKLKMPDFIDHMLTGISNATSAADDHSLVIPLILIIDLSVYKFRH